VTEDNLGPPRYRRHFVAIATSNYADPAFEPLVGVSDEVAVLRDWLCANDLGERAFTEAFPELSCDPGKRQIRDALEDPGRPWTNADAAVLYITGHGTEADGQHWIVLRDSDLSRPHRTAQRTAELVAWLRETNIEHLLIILDLCHAGATARSVTYFDLDFPATWLPLASVTPSQIARTGALATAISHFLRDLASPQGERFSHGPFLRVAEFLEEVQRHLGEDQTLATLRPGLPALGQHLCLPNPRWRAEDQPTAPARRDLAIRPAELESHWAPKAKATDETVAGWLFTGRIELMRRLIAAATGPPSATVVSGMAGTGKSAALARLVTLSDPGFCAQHASLIEGIPAQLRPPIGAVGAAVLATGKLPHEVFAQILGTFTGTHSPAGTSLAELRMNWWAWLATRDEPVTIVIDALDEAQHPATLLTEVLTQLNPDTPIKPQVRVIIGVRSPGGPDDPHDADSSAAKGIGALADHAEHLLAATRLRVDESPLWVDTDLTDYAHSLLTRIPGSAYDPLEHDAQAWAVAETIGARAGKSFLIARIAATSLAHRGDRTAPDDSHLLATLNDGVLGVFRADLHASLEASDRRRAVDLLRAVAFAKGAGLPWRQIWPIVANAVIDRPGTYGDSDIAWLLAGRIGAYLVSDQEDGITAYRLFHDILRSTLRERSTELFQPELMSPVQDMQEIERRIARHLGQLIEGPLINGCTTAPAPYLRRHLTEHAAAGDVFNDETLPAQFLPFADLARLREASGRTLHPNLRLLPVLRQVSHVWNLATPRSNASSLAVAAATRGIDFTIRTLSTWRVIWSPWRAPRAEILGQHDSSVVAVATTTLDRRQVAVTGSWDGTVRVWDLTTGTAVGDPLIGHTGAVIAVATTVLDGHPVAVTGSADTTVRVWDLTTGSAIGNPLTGHNAEVLTVAIAMLDGHPVAVTGSADDTMRIWNLITASQIGKPVTGHTNAVVTVATTELDGRPVAVTGSWFDRKVRIWDLTTGRAIGKPLTGHTGRVSAVATAELKGRLVAVTGSADNTVRMWDLTTGRAIGKPLTGHTHQVSTVATAELKGRLVAVSGSADNTVRMWDLTTGRAIGKPLTGHTGQISAMATTVLNDRLIAVTGSADDTVRVWDLTIGTPVGDPPSAHASAVIAMATTVVSGRAVAVTASWDDTTARMWDLTTGKRVGTLTGHASPVSAVATTVLDGRPAAVTGSWDHTARIWDLTTATRIGHNLSGHTGPVIAVAITTLDGRPVAVTGSDDGTVRMWDLTTATPIGDPFCGHTSAVSAVATTVFDGRPVAVTGSWDYTARLWDLTTGVAVGDPLIGHTSSVVAVATTVLDGRPIAATASWDATVRLWDLTTGTARGDPLIGHTREVAAVATTVLDGQPAAVTGSADGTVRIWDLRTQRQHDATVTVPCEINALELFSSSDKHKLDVVIAGSNGSLAAMALTQPAGPQPVT
jgi:WD40 repeat protein